MQRRIFFAVSLLACGMLIFEVLQTIILSMQVFSQNAFLVVSVAMLGLGGGGSLVTYLSTRQLLREPRLLLWASALGFAISLIVVNLVISRSNQLELLIFLSAFPYLFVGFFLSVLFSTFPQDISRSYFFDLVGSALGCLLVIWLMDWTRSAPKVIFFSAFLGFVSAILLGFLLSKRHLGVAFLLLALFLGAYPFADTLFPFHPSPKKHYGWMLNQPSVKTERLFSEWDYMGRLDTVRPIQGFERFPEENSFVHKHLREGGDFRFFFASGDNWSHSLKFRDAQQRDAMLRSATPASPYRVLRPKPEVLVIGVGGGIDLFLAVKNQAASVDAVEINPAMLRAARRLGKDWWDGALQDPRIRYHIMDGRTFAHTAQKKYDLITLTAVDTGAGLAKGGLMLSENYLYTKEAFAQYLSILKKEGLIFVSRPTAQLHKLALIAGQALKESGVKDLQRHFLFLGDGSWKGMMVFREPIPQEKWPIVEKALSQGMAGGELAYFPGQALRSIGYQLVLDAFKKADLAEPGRQNPLLQLITDDWPFFYFWDENFWVSSAGWLLARLLFWVFALGCLLILLPLWGTPLGSKKQVRGTTFLFFVGIGLGFMLAEIGILQQLILYLGHPTYSVSVTLSVLLLSTGVGSWLSGRIQGDPSTRLRLILLVIVGFLSLLGFTLSRVLQAMIFPSLALRIFCVLVLLFPLGLLFGMAFPLKSRLLAKSEPTLIPWAWAINAIASVLGSVLAMIFAMNLGFQSLLFLAALCYLMTWFAERLAQQSE